MPQYRGFGGDDLPDPRVILDHLKRNLRWVLIAVGLLIVIGLGFGSVFTVEPEEEAVVLRFGVPVESQYQPGLHFKIPIVDQVYIVPVKRQQSIEVGFRSDPGKVTTVNEKGYDRESLMLTGDLSLAHVRYSVLYKVADIKDYLFKVKDQEENVRDISMGVMRGVIGDYSLDEALTGKYGDIAANATAQTQTTLDEVRSGVEIVAVTIKSVEVPTEAKKAFDDLNRSVAEVRRLVIDAEATLNRTLGEVQNEQQVLIGAAAKRKALTLGNANGVAKAFRDKLSAYNEAPAITRQWLYLEAMRAVLQSAEDKLILDLGGADSGVLKLLPLTDGFGGSLSAPTPYVPAPKKAPGPAVKLPAGGGR